MGTAGMDFPGTRFYDGLRRLRQCAGRVGHIIKNNRHLIGDITDNCHGFGLIGSIPALIDDRQIRIQTLGKGPGSFHPSGIRRHDDQLVPESVFEYDL